MIVSYAMVPLGFFITFVGSQYLVYDLNRGTKTTSEISVRHIRPFYLFFSWLFYDAITFFTIKKTREQGTSLLPPAHADSSLAECSTLKMEAIRSSETSVHTRSTQRHIPEDVILQRTICYRNVRRPVACRINLLSLNL
jgi:hypothetical protein